MRVPFDLLFPWVETQIPWPAITGSIAEAYYKDIPAYIKEEVLKRLPKEFPVLIQQFYERFVGPIVH